MEKFISASFIQFGYRSKGRMRLRHIEVFRALMLTHSATRAAELLHTSQPTTSRFLGDLEREIGFKR